MKRNDEAELRGRVKDLRAALDRAGDRLDPELRSEVDRVLSGTIERLDLGVDHTVVALVGGTGSGKSSMFNAVSGLKFADVGVKRPTTSALTACSWSVTSGRLLDWLGVDEERRINRVSELDAGDEDALNGLILLDLPDYDSIAGEHRLVVDRVLPLVDLLVWVVDPQKYADDALHTGYLEGLAGTQGSMLVVLNQVDTVAQGQREVLLDDVRRLLAGDGLEGIDLLAASALTGEGIDEVRSHLARIVAKRSVAAQRVADEVSVAAQRVADSLPGQVPRHVDKFVDLAVNGLSRIIGLDALADAAAASETTPAGPGKLAATAVEPVRAGWVASVGQHLGPRWRDELEADVPQPAQLADQLSTALDGLGRSGALAGRRIKPLGWLGIGVGLAALIIVIGVVADLFNGGAGTVLILLAVLAAAGGIVMFLVGQRQAKHAATKRRENYYGSGQRRISDVVNKTLAEPTRALLEDHGQARALALAAIDSLTTGTGKHALSTK